MRLLSLDIKNFRNINRLSIEPSSGVNLFWGSNGQGKTNILEAIYYLVTGRSFRSRMDRETLPWDSGTDTVVTVKGRVQTAHSSYEIVVGISRNQKKVTCNGKTLSSLGLLWGKMNAVLFTPSDLSVVQGPPGERRRFLDMEGSQIDPQYLYHLQRYYQVLRQRNALLKTPAEEDELDANIEAWDHQMALSAAEIYCFRRNFIRRLASASSDIYEKISGSSENMDLYYDNFIGEDNPSLMQPVVESLYLKKLRKSRAEDLYRGTTTVGPHRDDFIIHLDKQNARTYASQGQQRTAIISLRLAEIVIMKEYTGHPPILLLDDIGSELDIKRRSSLLRLLGGDHQTFITGTDPDTLGHDLTVQNNFKVENGYVSETGNG